MLSSTLVTGVPREGATGAGPQLVRGLIATLSILTSIHSSIDQRLQKKDYFIDIYWKPYKQLGKISLAHT